MERNDRLRLRSLARVFGIALFFLGSMGILLPCRVGAQTSVPRRIISTAPSITELLFALGAGNRVVGVTTYCRFPPEAQSKPKIGDFASPNMEAILAQQPDLVIMNHDRKDLKSKFESFGLPLLILNFGEIENIFASTRKLAAKLQSEREGELLIQRIRRELAQIRQAAMKFPRPGVLFLIGRNPGTLTDLYAVGPRSYLGQIMEAAGADNVVSDLSSPYPKVSVEELLAKDPEVIIDMSHGEKLSEQEIRVIRSLWQSLPMLQAIRQDRIRLVDADVFMVPGPRLPEAVRLLARILHGSEFE